MSFFIVKRTYGTGSCQLSYKSYSLRNVLEELEMQAIDFVNHYEGRDRQHTFHKKSLTGRYSRQPLGYFIVKTNGKYPKFTVHLKTIKPGIIYNETKVTKIVSFQIAVLNNMLIEEPRPHDTSVIIVIPEEIREQYKKDKWDAVHDAIKKRSCTTDEKF